VIENFVPQPYPLECTTDGETWELVIGWRKEPTGEVRPLTADKGGVQYRIADTRPVVRSAQSAIGSSAPTPRREQPPRSE
jgi:hypothetical protein